MQQHFCASLLFIFQVDWGSIEFWNPFNVKWQKKRLTSLLHLFAWLFTSKLKCKRSNTTVDPIQFSSHHSSKSRTIRFLFFSSFFFTRIFPLFSSRLASPTLIPPQSIRGHNWKGYFHAKLIPNEGVKCCWLVGWYWEKGTNYTGARAGNTQMIGRPLCAAWVRGYVEILSEAILAIDKVVEGSLGRLAWCEALSL